MCRHCPGCPDLIGSVADPRAAVDTVARYPAPRQVPVPLLLMTPDPIWMGHLRSTGRCVDGAAIVDVGIQQTPLFQRVAGITQAIGDRCRRRRPG